MTLGLLDAARPRCGTGTCCDPPRCRKHGPFIAGMIGNRWLDALQDGLGGKSVRVIVRVVKRRFDPQNAQPRVAAPERPRYRKSRSLHAANQRGSGQRLLRLPPTEHVQHWFKP